MTDEQVVALLPHVEFFIEQVVKHDADGIDAVLAGIRKVFGVEPDRAVAVVAASLLAGERAKTVLVKEGFQEVVAERDRFAAEYVRAREKVSELREILRERTASSSASRKVAA